jgi:hypothetical protein
MADETVSVTALKYHTNKGQTYEAGDTYDVPAENVDNLVAQGMAKPTNAYEPPKKPSQPVEPMTTDTFGKA